MIKIDAYGENMRKFEMYVYFYNDIATEWGIKQSGYNGDDYSNKLNKPFGFATFCVKNDRFMKAFDLFLNEKCFNKTQELKLFDEVCEFECEINNIKSTKTMSIKEAFKIIYENFK